VPKAPYKIGVFDVLQVRAIGTLIDQPVDGYYLVEAAGTLPLGPSYGRVEVKGLSVEEAEAAITKKLSEVLQKPEVQVKLERTADQKEIFHNVAPPDTTYRIHPGALLAIHAIGTLQDQPIDDIFSVEPAGTVALGPAYGRADVKGLTLEEAEKAIQKKLQAVLTKPEVQVTFGGWDNENSQLARWNITARETIANGRQTGIKNKSKEEKPTRSTATPNRR
jgi:protein involved in polysaccharide export with SLBB domain